LSGPDRDHKKIPGKMSLIGNERRRMDRPQLPPRAPKGSIRNLDRVTAQISLMQRRKRTSQKYFWE